MTIGSNPLATIAGSSLTVPQAPDFGALNVGPAVRAGSLPGAPTGLPMRTQTGPAAAGLAPRHSNPAQFHAAGGVQAGVPLLPYPLLPGAGALGKVLVPHNEEFSPQRNAEITAWQIVLGAALQHMRPRFAGNRPDHVYVDTQQFREMSQAARKLAGDPGKYPVYLDLDHNHLVVDASRSFVHDDLTAQARKGLAMALGTDRAKITESGGQSPVTGGRRLAGVSRNELAAAAHAAATQGTPTEAAPRYAGRSVASTTRGADFFKDNTHHLIAEKEARLKKSRYMADQRDPREVQQAVMVHRGIIDNRNGIPENSKAAIDSAYAKGFRSIELDVQVTADHKLVLMHDFTTGRMTDDGQNRLVSQVSSEELLKKNLVIRNPLDGNFVVTDQKVLGVQDMLKDMLKSKPGLMVYLDCKESTAEAAITLLRDHPEFRSMTGLKFYAENYPGGYPQLLGKLMDHYGIDPVDPKAKTKRDELRQDLQSIKIIPILTQKIFADKDVQQFFPPSRTATGTPPHAETALTATELAASGMAWLKSWEAMQPVLLEVLETKSGVPEAEPLRMLRDQLREPTNSLSKVPSSGPYRYEDFSVQAKDGSKQYFKWTPFGGLTEELDPEFAARRSTAGAFQGEGDILLTDQPIEEMWAVARGVTLDRGHSGFELNVPAGTPVDTTFNQANVLFRQEEFKKLKKEPDVEQIHAVLQGMIDDTRPVSLQPTDRSEVLGGEHLMRNVAVGTALASAAVGLGVLGQRAMGSRRGAPAGSEVELMASESAAARRRLVP